MLCRGELFEVKLPDLIICEGLSALYAGARCFEVLRAVTVDVLQRSRTNYTIFEDDSIVGLFTRQQIVLD